MSASLAVQRLAALSGALAVTAGAYGAHGFRRSNRDEYQRERCVVNVYGWSLQCQRFVTVALQHGQYLSFLSQFGSFRSISMQETCSGWSNSPVWHGLLLWSSLPPGFNG
ncbi:transmembrane protein 256 isoform X2 [Ictalurus punctatus]|uniref:Transmembrane protein 256 isoform X2 n=1 Tax=Ictalurus punctatus TaxID=7998 RepID=A0A9F7RC85_ICTPU|nr:transmembrane protein 256 isoform X2 [Ictalurus punctatus]